MVEALCITGHDVDDKDKPGRFKRYVAGEHYEIPELNRYFKKVKAGTIKKAAEENATAETTDNNKGVKEGKDHDSV